MTRHDEPETVDPSIDDPVDGGGRDSDPGGPADPPAGSRRWFRTNTFLAFAGGVLVLLGNQFLGLIAVVLLAGDRTRDRSSRIGGAVLVFAWIMTWGPSGAPSPYASFALFAIAAVFLGQSTRQRRSGDVPGGWRAPAGLAAAAGALAVLALVPYGMRGSAFDEDAAVERVLAARADGSARRVRPADFAVYGRLAFQSDFDPVQASQRLVAPSRLRFTSAPIYYVVLLEQNPTTKLTGDGEPCFSASETHTVHGRSGRVVNLGRVDALKDDGGCLQLPRGTRSELEPIEGP